MGRRALTEIETYHGQPVLKDPTWTWEIPTYFFTGGLAGASAGLAYLSGLRGNDVLARRAWLTAVGAIGVSPPLLISDLGRPARFLNMLRMFKVTSPMSIGSWILSVSGTATAVTAANELTGRFARASRIARPAAALAGLPLSTYTAALIANTAVPTWHEGRLWLPFVFGSGAALSAGAAAVVVTPVEHSRPARRLALAAAAVEIASKELMQRRIGEVGEPYTQGAAGKLGNLSRACIVAGATLLARRGGSSRGSAAVAGGLLCAGALSARLSTFRAGFQSASDPRYVVGPQRARIRSGERSGAARREPKLRIIEPELGSPATAPVQYGVSVGHPTLAAPERE
ncbi:MAG: NrfD/PsrC family molybdoenzyme membrane anchor subunit [Solirubrobacteraceae bacterium]